MILPYGRHRKRDGFTFFAPDFYDQSLHDQREGIKHEAARLAKFMREIQKAYRCPDRIFVLGASQGGDLAFQLAHDHPNLVAAAFPMLGRNLVGRSADWTGAAPVQAYFSLNDPIVDQDQAEAFVGAIRDSGGTAEKKDFVAEGHDISEAMAASLAKALEDRMPIACKEPLRDDAR
jgi:phospholipase/carboxylesterase